METIISSYPRHAPAGTSLLGEMTPSLSFKIHDQATGGKSGRPKPELEALKLSALIPAVTARLGHHPLLAVLAEANFVLHSWLPRNESKSRAAQELRTGEKLVSFWSGPDPCAPSPRLV